MAFALKDIQIDPSVIIDSTVRGLQGAQGRGECPSPNEYDVINTAYSVLNSEIIGKLEQKVLPSFKEAVLMYRMFNGDAKQGEWSEGLARALEPLAEPYGGLIDSPHEIAELIATGNCSVLTEGSPYSLAVSMAPLLLDAEGGLLQAADILAKVGAPVASLLRATGVKSEDEIIAAERKEYEEKNKSAAVKRAEAETVESLTNFVVEDLTAAARGLLHESLSGAETFSEKQAFLAHNLDGVNGFTERHEAALSEAVKIDGGARLWVAEKILNKLEQAEKATDALAGFIESEGSALATVLENTERPDTPPVKQKRTKGSKTLTPDTIAISLIRNSSGITDGELCELIAVARPTLAKYTKGIASITLAQDAKDKLLEVIGRNIRELQEAEKILMGGEAAEPENTEDVFSFA